MLALSTRSVRPGAFTPACRSRAAALPRAATRTRVVPAASRSNAGRRGSSPVYKHSSGRVQRHRCNAAASTAGHKLITRSEVPAFIQRDDLIDQLYRWAVIETGEDCVRKFGLPMTAEQIFRDIEGTNTLWGFHVGVYKEGVKLNELAVRFDEDVTAKFEWVDRGADGFPTQGGKSEVVHGKNIEIWKVDENPVDEDTRSALKAFCTHLVGALNKYYSFGSVFAEDI